MIPGKPQALSLRLLDDNLKSLWYDNPPRVLANLQDPLRQVGSAFRGTHSEIFAVAIRRKINDEPR